MIETRVFFGELLAKGKETDLECLACGDDYDTVTSRDSLRPIGVPGGAQVVPGNNVIQ